MSLQLHTHSNSTFHACACMQFRERDTLGPCTITRSLAYPGGGKTYSINSVWRVGSGPGLWKHVSGSWQKSLKERIYAH